ncbi:unnamed protein product [Closterium sp. NIES-64]|nr:unnamed protein product [Closterium sp. NIES-64]
MREIHLSRGNIARALVAVPACVVVTPLWIAHRCFRRPQPDRDSLRIRSASADLGLFTFLFFSRLAYESRDAGSSVDGRDEGGLSCGFLPKLFSLVSNESLALHLRELTAKPHIAGTPENFATARYVKEKFESYGLRAHYADYPVLLSYPLRQSLRLASGRVSGKGAGEEEAEGEGAGKAEGAAVVYANYGRMEDFEELVAAIGEEQVKGAVALIRYGKTFRGDKVRNAERFGVAAVLLYSDPADYAPEGTDAEHVYPQQQWLPATGAQRGTIYTGKGDPATPGWPSHPGGERLSHKETAKRLPRIPVLPVGYSVAGAVMAHMGGSSVPEEWQGGMTDVQYVFGPGPAAVDLEVQMNATVTTIRNVIGVLPGSHQPDRLPPARQSITSRQYTSPSPPPPPPPTTTTPAPADPAAATTPPPCVQVHHSGQPSGCMGVWRCRPQQRHHLLARGGAFLTLSFSRPHPLPCLSPNSAGGQPRSTEWAEDNAPVLASSAVAYIHHVDLGSTEWVEDNAPVLATSAMAYINVDVAVGGGGFHASATPQLDDLIRDVSSQVGTLTSVAGCADGIEPCGGLSEYQPVANPDDPAGESILEGWAAEHSTSEPELGRLGGGGSDYAAFLQHLGLPAADTHFGGSYPMYHSVYDNYHWMATFADPLFKRHVAVTKMMAGVAARLAGDHRLPFNYSAYAAHLEHDVARLQADVAAQGAPSSLSVEPLFASVSRLLVAAQGIEAEIQVRIQAGIQGCTAVGCTAVGSTAVGCTAVGCTAVGCTAVGCTVVGCTAVGCTAVGCTAVGCTAVGCTAVGCTAPISHPPNPTHPSHHHSALQHPAAAHAGARGGGDAPWRAHLRKAQTEAIRPHPTPSHPATPPTTTAHRSGQQQRVQVHEGEGMPHGGGGDAPWRGRGCPRRGRGCPMEGEGMPHGGGGDCPMEGEGDAPGGGGDAPWRGRGCPMEGEGMPHGGGGDAPWRGRGCPMEGEGMPHGGGGDAPGGGGEMPHGGGGDAPGGGGDAPWRGRGCPMEGEGMPHGGGRGCPMEGEGMPHGGGGDAPWRGRGCPMEGEGMPHGGGGDAPWRGRGCPMEGEGMPHGGGGDAPGGGGDAPWRGRGCPMEGEGMPHGGGGDAPWRGRGCPMEGEGMRHGGGGDAPWRGRGCPMEEGSANCSSSACRCTRGRGCPMEEGSANCPSSKAFDAVNERLFLAERGFLDGHGIGPHYTWFKHLVYGPEKDNDYATSPFPGIRDAIADVISSSASKKENPEAGAGGAVRGSDNNEDGEEWKAVQHEIFRAARAIERAAKILEGQLL